MTYMAFDADSNMAVCSFKVFVSRKYNACISGSVGCSSNLGSGGCRFEPQPVSNILSWRFDREIFSTVILSLPLIQKGSCQFLAKEYAQYWLTA